MSKPPRGIARFDSAAAMLLALANALHDRPFASPSQSPTLDRLLPSLNRLPTDCVSGAMRWAAWQKASTCVRRVNWMWKASPNGW